MSTSVTDRQETAIWLLVGVLIASFVVYLLYAFFGALVVGLFLYYATRPVNRWLDDRFDHPDVSVGITLLLVGLPVMLVVGYAALVGFREFDQLLSAANLEQFRDVVEPYVDVVSSTRGQGLAGLVRDNLSRVTGFATAVFNGALRLFVVFTVAFYLLRDDRKVARWFRRTFRDHPAAVDFVERVDDDLTTIYTGNLITIGVTGLLAAAVFYGLDVAAPAGTGVPVPILLGLLVGVATLVPAVGMKIIYFPYTGYLLWESLRTGAVPLWFPVAFFLVTLVVVDSIPDLFVRSYLSKGELNMGLLLLTYVLGAVAFGWYGVFFGPVILVLFINFSREILPDLV